MTTSSQVCSACQAAMPDGVYKCVQCGSWKREIGLMREREKAYAGLGMFCLGVAICLLIWGIMDKQRGIFTPSPGRWYSMETTMGETSILGLRHLPRSREFKFSPSKFARSPFTWIMIVSATSGIMFSMGAIRIHNKLKGLNLPLT